MRPGLLCLAALLISSAAFGQSSSPGPYVLDVRGAMLGAPTGNSFYYVVPSGTLVPTRAFGLQVGTHVYPLHLGLARVGIGAEAFRTRAAATTPAASITSTPKPLSDVQASMEVSSVSGQVSFNFGTRDGWSYLTAGYGDTRTRSEVSHDALGPIEHSVVVLKRHTPTINYGGGARWFIREHLGVGFDVRFHRLRNPSKQIVGLSVGLSLR